MIEKGTKILCIDPIEGYLTFGKEYEFQEIESYAGRVVITDDRGKEGHFKPERFSIEGIDIKRYLILQEIKRIPDFDKKMEEVKKIWQNMVVFGQAEVTPEQAEIFRKAGFEVREVPE